MVDIGLLLVLNNGIILCFGYTTKSATTILPLTFQSTTTYAILVTVNYTTNDFCTYSMNVGNKTISSFRVTTQSDPGTNRCYYCAIGY